MLIAAEVLLIGFIDYGAGHYLPFGMGRYVSLDVLYCLPIIQAARLAAVHATVRFGSPTFIGIAAALLWSAAEMAVASPDFPLGAFVLNAFTRSVAFTVLGAVVARAWRDRRSEQRFKTLSAGTSEGVAISARGCFLDVNEQLTQMLGYERHELIGRAIRSLIPPEDQDRVMGNIEAGREIRHEHEMLRKDGARIIVSVHGQTLDQDGVALRLTAISDITEQRRVEQELNAAKAEAERANNAKSRFLAAASHDLRQPLSALQLYVDVLQNRLDAKHQPILANMQECVAGLGDLLSKLLDLSKLEAGVVTPQVSSFACDNMLGMVLAAHAPAAEAKGLRLSCRFAGLAARTDLVLYQRILGNLVSNAIQFTAAGGVLIGCRRHEGRMWVEVWDSGIGIPADKTGEIFEEFKQLGDEARTRGSGLGLTIAARTASLLGLCIRVQSRLGRGSMFAIELPLVREQPAPPAPAPAMSVRHARIALVDDNPQVLDALALALQSAGHEVIAAASGAGLLAELGARQPDLMVCDYRLGAGETGLDVIASVRTAFGNELPAILITGDTDPALVRSMAGKGVTIQHKPLHMGALRTRIEEVMAA